MPENQNIEIVGIAAIARLLDLRDAGAPVIFLSYLQDPPQSGNLIVRTEEAPDALIKAPGHEIESLGHE